MLRPLLPGDSSPMPDEQPSLPTRTDTFLIAEYESLRREIELEIKELGEFLRYGFLSSGGVWAWLLTQPKERVVTAAFFIPFVVSILFNVETRLVRHSIFGLGSYLREVEAHFALPGRLGWEHRIQASSRKKQKLMKWEHVVWNLLIGANLAAAVYMSVKAATPR